MGDTYILNATLTQLPGENLLASFRAESRGKAQPIENITARIAPELKQTLSKKTGVSIAGGRNISQVATNSFTAYTHFVRGFDFNNEGKWQEAAKELDQALQIDPTMGIAWSELACAYSFAGDEAKAHAAQKKAIELKSRMTRKESMLVDANSLRFTGNGENYRAKMQEFLKEFPDDRMGYFYIGLSWQWLDRNLKEALRWYEMAYNLTPEYYPVTKALVDSFLELNQKEQAVGRLATLFEECAFRLWSSASPTTPHQNCPGVTIIRFAILENAPGSREVFLAFKIPYPILLSMPGWLIPLARLPKSFINHNLQDKKRKSNAKFPQIQAASVRNWGANFLS